MSYYLTSQYIHELVMYLIDVQQITYSIPGPWSDRHIPFEISQITLTLESTSNIVLLNYIH
jgi:hypothetical protein